MRSAVNHHDQANRGGHSEQANNSPSQGIDKRARPSLRICCCFLFFLNEAARRMLGRQKMNLCNRILFDERPTKRFPALTSSSSSGWLHKPVLYLHSLAISSGPPSLAQSIGAPLPHPLKTADHHWAEVVYFWWSHANVWLYYSITVY